MVIKFTKPGGRAKAPAEAGFTLIEMVVTISVFAIIVALAVPSFMTYQRNSGLTSVANTLLSSFSAARSEAMRRGLNVFVVPATGNDWTSGWVVFVDTNGSLAFDDPGDDVLSREPATPSWITAPNGGFIDPNNNRAYLMFNGSGYARLVNGAFQESSLDITNGTETRRIIASPTGRLRVCDPEADAGCAVGVL